MPTKDKCAHLVRGLWVSLTMTRRCPIAVQQNELGDSIGISRVLRHLRLECEGRARGTARRGKERRSEVEGALNSPSEAHSM